MTTVQSSRSARPGHRTQHDPPHSSGRVRNADVTITRERAGSLKPAPLKTSATSSRPIVAHPARDAALSRLTANPQSRAWRQLPAIDRFQASVVIGPVPEHAPDLGPCLLWLGAPTTKGYGVLNDAGKKWFAHRWSIRPLHRPHLAGL